MVDTTDHRVILPQNNIEVIIYILIPDYYVPLSQNKCAFIATEQPQNNNVILLIMLNNMPISVVITMDYDYIILYCSAIISIAMIIIHRYILYNINYINYIYLCYNHSLW